MLFNDKIKKIINDRIKSVNEAYVGQKKKYDIVTDFLSEKNIDNHIKLYEDYLEYAKAWGARYFPMSVVDMTETEKYYYEEFDNMLESLRRLDPVDNWREIQRKFNFQE